MRVLASRQFGNVGLEWIFEPRDVWWGLYWCHHWHVWRNGLGSYDDQRFVHVYVCLLPLLPLRLRIPCPIKGDQP